MAPASCPPSSKRGSECAQRSAKTACSAKRHRCPHRSSSRPSESTISPIRERTPSDKSRSRRLAPAGGAATRPGMPQPSHHAARFTAAPRDARSAPTRPAPADHRFRAKRDRTLPRAPVRSCPRRSRVAAAPPATVEPRSAATTPRNHTSPTTGFERSETEHANPPRPRGRKLSPVRRRRPAGAGCGRRGRRTAPAGRRSCSPWSPRSCRRRRPLRRRAARTCPGPRGSAPR